jgi:cytochrome o ubiquinol oxidase operon protein cyoD
MFTNNPKIIDKKPEVGHGSLLSYTVGFVCSVILTAIAYLLVTNHVLDGTRLIAALLGLGLVQLVVQLVFFLHMGRESSPRWNLTVFMFTGLIVLIIGIGSLWIMHNLTYNMAMPADMTRFTQDQEAIHP